MVMAIDNDFYIDRASLSEVFKDPRTLLAFESALQVVQATPESIDEVQAAADAAAADAAAADAAAVAAQGTANAIAAAPFATFAASAALSNERVFTAANNVSFDLATAAQIKIIVDALAILNAAAINLTQALTTTQAVDVQALLRCDSFRIDQTPTASVTAATHYIPISANGTIYYLKASATP